jgi:glycosyltransferase involved in cell wall biosynthesis
MAARKKLRIALLAPLWKTVPPTHYGGSELVVANLAKAYTKLGHKVTTFACGGSKPAGKLVKVIDRPLYDLLGGFTWKGIPAQEFFEYDAFFKRRHQFDVVHNHLGFHPLAFSSLLDMPMVTTLHSSLPPDFPELAHQFRDRNFVSISDAQRTLAPRLNYLKTIYHGIDTAAIPYVAKPKSYLLFLSSLIKNKGIDLAVRAARDLQLPLIIAGEVREPERAFLNKTVFPYVDGKQIRFVGEVNNAQKIKLMSQAKALVLPVRWSEAFGLVMVEAMASGTPVVSFRKGSVPEVIEHGRTGYVVDTFSQFKRAIQSVSKIDRGTCRKTAVQQFDLLTMGQQYIDLFKQLL